MINEEKVKIMCNLAIFDEKETKKDKEIGRYFQKDYVIKEMIISFFSGTIVFALVLVLVGMYQAEAVLDSLNTSGILQIAVVTGLVYMAFLALYLLVTYLVCQIRYTKRRRELKKYIGRLRAVNHMYEREDLFE